MKKNRKPFKTILKNLTIFMSYVPYIKKSENRKKIVLITLYVIFRILAFFICVLPSLIHFIVFKRAKMDADTSEDFPLFIGGTGIGIVCAIFPFYSKRWSILLRQITKFNVFGIPHGTEKTINFHHIVTVIFRVYCFFGAILYAMVSLYEAKECYEIKAKSKMNIICTSMIPIWLPLEINHLFEWTIFFVQFIIVQFALIPAGSICFLIWEVADMLVLHIELLKVTIENIMQEKIRKKRRKLLKLWISYHLQIIEIIREFNFLTKACMGLFSLIAALVFACILYQVVNMNKLIGACLHLWGWLVALYMVCNAGQTIQDGTESIGMAVYNSKWYTVDIDTQKAVLFIIRRCQRPLYLQALPLGELNHPLMLMIFKTSYSFLALLTHSTQERRSF